MINRFSDAAAIQFSWATRVMQAQRLQSCRSHLNQVCMYLEYRDGGGSDSGSQVSMIPLPVPTSTRSKMSKPFLSSVLANGEPTWRELQFMVSRTTPLDRASNVKCIAAGCSNLTHISCLARRWVSMPISRYH